VTFGFIYLEMNSGRAVELPEICKLLRQKYCKFVETGTPRVSINNFDYYLALELIANDGVCSITSFRTKW
jgi:hypothetical protein